VNCEWPPICPPLHHICLSPIFGNLTCLHIKHVNNGIDDCLGAFDERQFCRQTSNFPPAVRYRCSNTNKCISSNLACMPSQCPINGNSSMNFCQNIHGALGVRCVSGKNLTHTEQLLCTLTDHKYVTSVQFSLIGLTSYASLQMPCKLTIFLSPL